LQGTGVTANALHPGFVATNFGHNGNGVGKWIIGLTQRWALAPEEGAQTSIYLASSPDVAGVSGEYFVDKKITQPSNAAQDDEAAKRLWDVSLALVDEQELEI
jgi:NAD(P)-dependent dehydrogenase (short-subunit alcohol dehydrogenase family)